MRSKYHTAYHARSQSHSKQRQKGSANRILDPNQPSVTIKSYLCKALHNIPDYDSLKTIPNHKQSNYFPFWLKPKQKILADSVCIASLCKDKIILIPTPNNGMFLETDAPYIIGYDFRLAAQKTFIPVARYYGFVIASMPDHDMNRMFNALGRKDYAEALLFCDRAVTNLASINPESVNDSVERRYNKFAKLRNLFLDQFDTCEGLSAASLAIKQGTKCFQELMSVSATKS